MLRISYGFMPGRVESRNGSTSHLLSELRQSPTCGAFVVFANYARDEKIGCHSRRHDSPLAPLEEPFENKLVE